MTTPYDAWGVARLLSGREVVDGQLERVSEGLRPIVQRLAGTALNDRYDNWIAMLAEIEDAESFVEAIADPYFSDALSIGVRGMLNRRLELDASADASTGNIGVTRGSEDNGLTSYGSRIELTYGLTRFLALQFSHFYYHYAFGSDVTLPETLASAYDRQSALVTLNVWLPLIASVRRTNASR